MNKLRQVKPDGEDTIGPTKESRLEKFVTEYFPPAYAPPCKELIHFSMPFASQLLALLHLDSRKARTASHNKPDWRHDAQR